MKFLRYGPAGAEKPGMLDASGGLRDLSAHVMDLAGISLLPQSLAALAALDPEDLPLVHGTPRIGPCVGAVGKFLAIGLNYADHAAEAGMDLPQEPIVFSKATSCIVGPNDDVEIPRGSTATDWEVELGFVIGKKAKYVTEAEALNHVAGYCVINDVSERDFQIRRSGQWIKGKSADTFGPIGPWLVTPDEVGDPQDLALYLDVNGVRRQDGTTRTMHFTVAQIIAHLSQFMTLHPGDVIATGTPPGVGMGMKPPLYLKAGDVMELGVAGLGVQRQQVRGSD
ncbi:fumarylacetoacetate hydrolase family protein [Puniceibacterium sediminis]|uniref:2-keto-4-pentenoate hydratase/2-oxohepta-3-ene-1,7-dioic acid hydratase (Catechol pathway) n=1 Tax=Puniceibacterium sediminis TaxID=1608407 RepID=A0A238UTT5_9RHOB|nr:fumarylacetoacetate hydrolase family protein [Puniceibacterium sediminis]SNR25117.1 2-keto-4-pentenoate hydratase/2-oxohepta-3-ene-1,7-dioic acid hydratase (catechol pathway) [Puniceibacterium sediminis]